LTDFPVANDAFIDKALEEKMQIAQQISSMVLALRRKVNIKVRQPLQMLMIPVVDKRQKEAVEAVQSLILNEVNVKTIKYVDNAAEILIKRIKPDFKKLGPRYGKIMKDLAAAITNLSQQEIAELEKTGVLEITVASQTAEITAGDVEIFSEDIPGWLVANEGKLTVALDITVTEELKKEGIARELVNRIQNIRKSNGYEITDKIHVVIQREPHVADAVEEYSGYIAAQVLASSVTLAGISEGIELDMEDYRVLVQVEKE
jgi:isoleucyl-tRNA synthetase